MCKSFLPRTTARKMIYFFEETKIQIFEKELYSMGFEPISPRISNVFYTVIFHFKLSKRDSAIEELSRSWRSSAVLFIYLRELDHWATSTLINYMVLIFFMFHSSSKYIYIFLFSGIPLHRCDCLQMYIYNISRLETHNDRVFVIR